MRSLLLLLLSCQAASAFTLSISSPTSLQPSLSFPRKNHHHHYKHQQRRQQPPPHQQNHDVALYMNNNQFDVSKPSFDLLSFRSVRGDALVRYDALNQSEPLRITLYTISAATLLSAPTLSEALGYDAMSLPATATSILGSITSIGLLIRECNRRRNQLIRIEKELNTEFLPIRQPNNVLADSQFAKPITLKELRASTYNPPRIIALCGTKQRLKEALDGLVVLRRRLFQASVLVVPVPIDGSKLSDWGISSNTAMDQWLADCSDASSWMEYFNGLSESSSTTTSDFLWFGLNSNGKSFGSGENEIPQWIQVLGQHLRPTEILDESDKPMSTNNNNSNDSQTAKILAAQSKFYDALTSGNEDAMKEIYSNNESSKVQEIIGAGGRIDSWKDCLMEGARPKDMVVSGGDAILFSDTEAYSTIIEFPANAEIDSATLLAVQKWEKESQSNSGEWKLQLHQTIPWSPEAKAQGILLCDCRGCVALTRGPERRTFGGLIG